MATDSKPKPQPYYPPGFVPPKAKVAEAVAPVAAEVPQAAEAPKAAPQVSSAELAANFKAEMRSMAAALDRGEKLPPPVGVFSPESEKEAARARTAAARAETPKTASNDTPSGPSKPNLAPSAEVRAAAATAQATAQAAAKAPQTPPVVEAKMEKPATKGDTTGADKADQPAKVAKAEKAPSAPKPEPVVAKSRFAQALQADAKEHVRANSVVAAAVAQGLTPDAIKALAEHRLQGPARDFAVAMTSGAQDTLGVGLRLAESQKITSALQSAAVKAETPEQAQSIIAAKLTGDLAVAANSTISTVAGLDKPALAAAPAAPQVAAAAPEPVATPAASTAAQTVAAQAVVPEATGVTAYAVSPQDGVEARPLDQAVAAVTPEKAPIVEMSTVAAAEQKAPIVEMSTAAVAEAPAPLVEKSTVAAAPEKGPIVELSTMAAAEPKAHIVERSTVAAASAPAPIVEKSTMAAAEQKAPIVDMSTVAAAGQKAPIVEMSTMAKAQPSEAPAASSVANSMEKALHEAFSMVASKVQEVPTTVASLVQESASKANAAFEGATAKVNEVIQAAAAAGARPSLEEALASHMKDKGFDMQSIAVAGSIAEAIRESRTSRELGDAVLVLHKGGADGDPLASVVAVKDVPSIASKGDSVLALDTLEKVAANGMDKTAVQELRSAMPEAVKGQSDLELAQIHGEAKTAVKGLDGLGQPHEQQQQQQQQQQSAKDAPEKVAQAEMAGGGGMSM